MAPGTLDLLKEREKRGEGSAGGRGASLASTPEQFTCARSAAQRRGTPVEGERKRGGRRGSSGTSAAGREREGKRIDGVAGEGRGATEGERKQEGGGGEGGEMEGQGRREEERERGIGVGRTKARRESIDGRPRRGGREGEVAEEAGIQRGGGRGEVEHDGRRKERTGEGRSEEKERGSSSHFAGVEGGQRRGEGSGAPRPRGWSLQSVPQPLSQNAPHNADMQRFEPVNRAPFAISKRPCVSRLDKTPCHLRSTPFLEYLCHGTTSRASSRLLGQSTDFRLHAGTRRI